MKIEGKWASEKLKHLEASQDRLSQAIALLGTEGLDHRIRDGWTVKEMLAHLAFWEETSLPVIEGMFRGGPEVSVEEWYGGSDLEMAPDTPWPDADTHNEREARWARSHTHTEVLDRLHGARRLLMKVTASITDEEGNGQIGQHLTEMFHHTESHLAELELISGL